MVVSYLAGYAVNYCPLTVYCMEGVFRSLFLGLVLDLSLVHADVFTVSTNRKYNFFFIKHPPYGASAPGYTYSVLHNYTDVLHT